MDEQNQVPEAVNSEAPEAVSSEESLDLSKFVPKDKYHATVGKLHKEKEELEKKLQQLQSQGSEDTSEQSTPPLNEDTIVELLEKAERKKQKTKEEQAFLASNPEAFEHIDTIRNIQKTIAPTLSLQTIYQRFLGETTPQQAPKPNINTNVGGGGTPETKKQIKIHG